MPFVKGNTIGAATRLGIGILTGLFNSADK